LTFRGGLLGFGWDDGAWAAASAPPSGELFGGVRDERLGPLLPPPPPGGATLGISRRVISPCPTVQRFVVIQ
jgi:hypothetical protein